MSPEFEISLIKNILQRFLKPLQNIFAFTDGYSVSRTNEKEKLESKCSIELINSLQAEDFKKLCAEYFSEKSYQAKENIQIDNTPIDIGLYKQSFSSTLPFGVIKCWPTKAIPVKEDDINQFKGILADKQIPFGAFITAGKFQQTISNNDDKRLQLIDGQKLLNLIQTLPEVRKQRLLKKFSSIS